MTRTREFATTGPGDDRSDGCETAVRTVAHGLQTHLAAATAALELARTEGDPSHFERARRDLERVERLLDDVEWLARDGADRDATRQVDLRRSVENVWTVAVPDSSGAELVVDAPLGTVDADGVRVCHLLDALFRNALERGGRDVIVRVERTDCGFAVEDDGPDLPTAERRGAFEPGYSIEGEGTELGFHVVDAVASAHDWDVRLRDAGGVRFEFLVDGSTGET